MKKKEIAIVTGGANGIGLACALRLFADHLSVCLVDKDQEALDASQKLFKQSPDQDVVVKKVDITNVVEIRQLLIALDEYQVKVIVNCAGILSMTPLESFDYVQYEKILSVNLTGAVALTVESIPCMKPLGGAIINVVSNVVISARVGNTAYSASKSALLGITKVMALELAHLNIRVNAISPGTTDTKLLQTYDQHERRQLFEGDLKKFRIGIPLNKLAEVSDHANAVAFLASDQARHITGQNLVIDGGQTLA